ncbi:MAG: helix-turn-helix transcriptional regulator [Solirubrobacterales bacterium]|nr:helix-turn-helix transcriptional regulator [Solirubrobacterales bacterium]
MSQRRAQLHYLRGAIPDAIADAQAAINAGDQFGQTLLLPSLYGTLIDALLEANDVRGAERALAHSGVSEQLPDILLFSPLIHSRGRLRLAQGDTQAGIDDLLAGYRLLARFGITNPVASHGRSIAAVAQCGLGRREDARNLVAQELAVARKFGAPATIGISLRASGVIEPGIAGIIDLREAVSHLQRSPARLEHARALADLGAGLRRAGRRREAQLTLRQALDLADRCGGKAVAERARTELLVTGARPRRTRVTGVEALTARELRVAQLAVEGLTNRQIAQALFVSQPTVATHLSHCYQKLDINSREQLPTALAQSQADDP